MTTIDRIVTAIQMTTLKLTRREMSIAGETAHDSLPVDTTSVAEKAT